MSQSYYCGVDFGTTNTVCTLLPKNNPAAPGMSCSIPSLAFFPKRGFSATAQYAPGKLEYFIGEQASLQAYDQRKPGRVIHSFKSVIADPNINHIFIYDKNITIIDLLQFFFKEVKSTIDTLAGEPITRITVGRPVKLARTTFSERIARQRIITAARKVGFSNISFAFEPIAAFVASKKLRETQGNFFISDIGGGTSDFVAGSTHGASSITSVSTETFVTGGVHSAGDAIDGEIMWSLTPYFGNGAKYTSMGKQLDIPVHLFTLLKDKPRVSLIDEAYLEDLEYILKHEVTNHGIGRLYDLSRDNMALPLYKAIESTKVKLTNHAKAKLKFSHKSVQIDQEIARIDFDSTISSILKDIEQTAVKTLERAKITAPNVEIVLLTGGTSLIPAVRNIFTSMFPNGHFEPFDPFSAVSKGLALIQNNN